MKHLLLFSLMAIGFSTWAQTPSTTASTPTQVCTKLIEATKSDNYEAVAGMMMAPEHKMKKDMKAKQKAKFDKMHSEYLADIRNMACTSEQVAGDHAMVVAQTQNEKRLIPFVQKEGEWKFDMHTYRAFYMQDKHMGDKKGMKPKTM